jgi:hypothetical protein
MIMPHTEEKEFTLRLELRCTFPDDYQGDEDGYAWAGELSPLLGAVIAAALQAIGRHPGWKVRPKNRGRSSDDEVTLLVERQA